jgi:hypothetical protein
MTVSATGDIVKGELPSVEEAAEAQTQDDAPLEDAEAIVETEQPKVWGSGAQCLWTQVL